MLLPCGRLTRETTPPLPVPSRSRLKKLFVIVITPVPLFCRSEVYTGAVADAFP